MRKFYKVLLIAVIIAAVAVGFSMRNFANANIHYDAKALSQELSEALRNQIISNYSEYYKNIGVEISVEKNSVKVKDGVASAVFDAKINVTLKANKVEDLPFMKGMLNYYNSKKASLSKAQIKAANNLIDDWKLELKDYIGKPEPTAYAIYKITATVGKDGNIEKNSIKLYIAEPSSTGKGDAFYPVPMPMFGSYEKMERNGEEAMKETLNKAGASPIVNNTKEAENSYDNY